MENLILLISIVVIASIVYSILKSLLKKTLRTVFFISIMLFLRAYLKISYPITMILFFWINFMVKDLFIDFKSIIKHSVSSYKKYKNKWLEKIVIILLEANYFVFKFLVYSSCIYIIFKKEDFIYTIEISCILLVLILIVKWGKKCINKIFMKITRK